MDDAFHINSYEFDETSGDLIFVYSYPQRQLEFREKVAMPGMTADLCRQIHVAKTLRAMQMALAMSYYKLYCPDDVVTDNFTLQPEEKVFWQTVYRKGLGEFFYRNEIDFRSKANFVSGRGERDEEKKAEPNDMLRDGETEDVKKSSKALVAFGGGKDSIVTLELLKESNIDCDLFTVNPQPIHEQAAAVSGKELLTVRRTIDSKILEYNKRSDTLNGHVPVTFMNICISLLYAIIHGYDSVIFSNEWSSNYGNVEYLGESVNHQWSKSFEAEKMLQDYVTSTIGAPISFFSLLRPLYEISIAGLFASYPKYFEVFSSSNHNFKLTKDEKSNARWEVDAPKSLFVYCILGFWLDKEKMQTIFGEDLLALSVNMVNMKELLGLDGVKPFECVGTPAETYVGLERMHTSGDWVGSVLMDYFAMEVLGKDVFHNAKPDVTAYMDDSRIPERFRPIIQQAYKKLYQS